MPIPLAVESLRFIVPVVWKQVGDNVTYSIKRFQITSSWHATFASWETSYFSHPDDRYIYVYYFIWTSMGNKIQSFCMCIHACRCIRTPPTSQDSRLFCHSGNQGLYCCLPRCKCGKHWHEHMRHWHTMSYVTLAQPLRPKEGEYLGVIASSSLLSNSRRRGEPSIIIRSSGLTSFKSNHPNKNNFFIWKSNDFYSRNQSTLWRIGIDEVIPLSTSLLNYLT